MIETFKEEMTKSALPGLAASMGWTLVTFNQNSSSFLH